MISLELPHITVLSKCDLVEDKTMLDEFLNFEENFNNDDYNENSEQDEFNKKNKILTNRIKNIIFDYNLLNFYPMNINEEETLLNVLYQCDNAIQYGENLEPNEGDYIQAEQKLMNN